MSRLRGRLDRLERRLPSNEPSDSDVIRVWMDLRGEFDGPASHRAALDALPRSELRDYFLSGLDADGNLLPDPPPPARSAPGTLTYSTTALTPSRPT